MQLKNAADRAKVLVLKKVMVRFGWHYLIPFKTDSDMFLNIKLDCLHC
jgi:hypothetical protein